jgi:DNA-binding CsgD family transcriptional regulator
METQELLAEFYSLCERALRIEDIANALFDLARGAGFSHATYLRGGLTSPNGLLLTNYPDEWRSRYFAQRYERIDPILLRTRRILDPFLWGDPLVRADMSPQQLRMMEDAREHKVGHGYAVPLHSSFYVNAACMFACAHNDIPPTSCKTMRRASVIAHEHICRLSRRAQNCEHISELSLRERECLALYAQSLSDAEIAHLQGISAATVRRHLNLARLRLKAATRQEAVVKALISRQIDPSRSRTAG